MNFSLLALLRSRSGNFSQMMALMTVPLIGALGLAVDYSESSRMHSNLLGAADAAALGAIVQGSPAVKAASLMENDGDVAVGRQDAIALFNGYLVGEKGATVDTLQADVRKTGAALTATVSFRAKVPTAFMGIFGHEYTSVTGSSTASMPLAPFMDFYVLLDNSPSMGVGATPRDIDLMVSNTPDKCAFACHELSNANNYYNLAKTLRVVMRIDVVRLATQAMTRTAEDIRNYDHQYRMGVYTFGAAATDMKLTELIAPTEKLDRVRQASSAVDLMTIPHQGYDNDQQTNFDKTIADLDKKIGTPGSGSTPADAQKIVILISDGVGDSYKPSKCTKRTTGGRCQEPIDIRSCTALKDRGVKVAVLYATYLPLPTNAWYNTWIKPFQNEISVKMKECATPGFFFEVGPSEGITEALDALFRRVVTTLRLTG